MNIMTIAQQTILVVLQPPSGPKPVLNISYWLFDTSSNTWVACGADGLPPIAVTEATNITFIVNNDAVPGAGITAIGAYDDQLQPSGAAPQLTIGSYAAADQQAIVPVGGNTIPAEGFLTFQTLAGQPVTCTTVTLGDAFLYNNPPLSPDQSIISFTFEFTEVSGNVSLHDPQVTNNPPPPSA
jgi:hypothetical protein